MTEYAERQRKKHPSPIHTMKKDCASLCKIKITIYPKQNKAAQNNGQNILKDSTEFE
jgi:hypothetical protein